MKRKDELDQAEPFDEDNWTDVTIGSYQLQVYVVEDTMHPIIPCSGH